MKAACHCTRVRLAISTAPKWVTDCNCTLCRRYGGLWAYFRPGEVKLVEGEDALGAYLWNDRAIGFHFCLRCGCVTHYSIVGTDPLHIRAVNVRMIPALDPAAVKLMRLDNSHTGCFWTRTPDKNQPGSQPKMPPPAAEDWRWSSYNNFVLDKASVAACPVQA